MAKEISDAMQKAFLIRKVEELFLDLFSKGALMGTVHTCIGQEFSGIAFCRNLRKYDYVVSNHRCHGHYIAHTGDVSGLIAELMGRSSGVCAGIGSSQHLCSSNFFSNGIQGGMTPIAAGLALSCNLSGSDGLAVAFIGDGTLGEGIVYETMNMASKFRLPLLIVCEHNEYAQSTPTCAALAGDILARPAAFGIKTFESDTEFPETLLENATASCDYVRNSQKPAFHLVNTYRLAPHSKGDDFRAKNEIEARRAKDPICAFCREDPEASEQLQRDIDKQLQNIIFEISTCKTLHFDEYVSPLVSIANKSDNPIWTELPDIGSRFVHLLNQTLDEMMAADSRVVLLGEDIQSPYGGAFKVTKGLSDKYPRQVFSTPISEAAMTGICNGLALSGMRPILEIMFGDFITLCMDQLINHAAKFRHMYNRKVTCPVIVRAPMGGGRAYGPTHSQSLEKHLLGVDTLQVVSTNSCIHPKYLYPVLLEEDYPTVVIENKSDYSRFVGRHDLKDYIMETDSCRYPTVRVRPRIQTPELTIVAYAGGVHWALESLERIFIEFEMFCEVIIPTRLYPLDLSYIAKSVTETKRLLSIEEGSLFSGFGSELITQLHEKITDRFRAARVGAEPFPIPAASALEKSIFPNVDKIINTIGRVLL